MNGKIKVLLALILLMSGWLCFYGLDWGNPDQPRKELLFGRAGDFELFLAPMERTRADIYQYSASLAEFLAKGYRPGRAAEQVAVRDKKGKVRVVSVTIIDCLRTYLLRSYGADEQRSIIALSRFNLSRKEFNPHFFSYGGAYLYPLALTVKLAEVCRFLKLRSGLNYYLKAPEDMGRIFTTGRFLGALAVLLSVVFFFLFSRALFDEKTALLASFLYAACPAVILWAHYLKPYGYGLLWFNAALFFSVSVWKGSRWRSDALLAALCCGLAAGSLTTYGYAFFGLVLGILGHYFRLRPRPFPVKVLLLNTVVFLFVFLAVNPYLLPSFREYLLESREVAGMWSFGLSRVRVFYFLGTTLRYGLGNVLWVLAAFGFLLALFRRRPEDVFLLLMLLPFLFYSASSTPDYVHYALPVFPILALLAGSLLSLLGLAGRPFKIPVRILMFMSAAVVAFYGFAAAFSFGAPNTRDIAGAWIKENIPAGSAIAMYDLPSPYRTPPFPFADYRLAITGFETDAIKSSRAAHFLLSEYHWLRVMPKAEIIARLEECGYREIKRIEKPVRIGWFTFRRRDNAPDDWCHPDPGFIIYRKD